MSKKKERKKVKKALKRVVERFITYSKFNDYEMNQELYDRYIGELEDLVTVLDYFDRYVDIDLNKLKDKVQKRINEACDEVDQNGFIDDKSPYPRPFDIPTTAFYWGKKDIKW